MRVAGVEKIFLSQVADVRSDFVRDVQVVIDNETDIGAARDRQNFFRHDADFVRRRIFGAQLN